MNYLKLLVLIVLAASCEDIIYVDDISKQSVAILAPSDQSQLENTSVLFSWTKLADSLDYRLQVAIPNFEAATQIVLDTTVKNTSFSKTLEPNSYQWRIRAQNSDYETLYTTQSFTVSETATDNFSNQKVVLLVPQDTATIALANNEITFSWEALENAETYTLEIASPDFESGNTLIEEKTTSEINFTKTLEAGTYQWRVKASNLTLETMFSTQTFTIAE